MRLSIAAATAGVLLSATSALAEIHDFSMQIQGLTWDPYTQGQVENLGDGINQWTSGAAAFGDITMDYYDCQTYKSPANQAGGAGGFIDAAFQFTNNSATNQTFSLLMTLNTGGIGPVTEMNGSVGVTVTNNQAFGDATIWAPSGGSIYRSFTDLVDPFADTPAKTLLDDPYSLTATGAFAGQNDGDLFGNETGPNVANSISIMFEVELSPGDSASVSGLFEIAAVPAPSALALLGLAGVTRRRRRC